MTCNSDVADRLKVLRRGMEKEINLRQYDDDSVSLMYIARPWVQPSYSKC